MSSISLVCFMYLIMSLKDTDTSTYEQVLMLHQDTRWQEHLKTKKANEVGVVFEGIYNKEYTI